MLHRILPKRCPRITRLYLLAALSVVLSATPVHTQTWEPTARLWGWGMNKYNWVQVGDGITRVHLYSPEGGGVYNLTALSPDAEPVESLHGISSILMRGGDINGNGVTDVMGLTMDERKPVVLLDMFTSEERQIPFVREGVRPPGFWIGKGTLEDLDHDGISDAFADKERDGYALISYGDSLDPLSQQSLVPYTNAATPYAKAVCLGTLEGKACMLRITWWWERKGPDSTQMRAYTLDVLNEQDLRERRDTIRYETVQRYNVGDYGWAYRDCFIIFDDVWQLTHYNARRTCLRVQLSGFEEHEPDPSFMMPDTILIKHGSMYGQAARQNDAIVRVDGRQPFVAWYSAMRILPDTSFQVNIPNLLEIVDPFSLESRFLGRMSTAYTDLTHGGQEAACTTPDIDGDGIGEVLLYYHATSPITGKQERLVDLFLTSDRPTTGVESREHRAQSTEECASSVRSLDGWTLVCAMQSGLPASPTGCFDDAAVARVFDAQGRQVAEIPVVYGAEVRLHDPGTLPGSPLWAVIGSCTVRLQ